MNGPLCNIRCRLHVTLGLHNRCSFWGHFPYVHSVPVYVFQNWNETLFSKIKKKSIWNILKKDLQKRSPKRSKVRLVRWKIQMIWCIYNSWAMKVSSYLLKILEFENIWSVRLIRCFHEYFDPAILRNSMLLLIYIDST